MSNISNLQDKYEEAKYFQHDDGNTTERPANHLKWDGLFLSCPCGSTSLKHEKFYIRCIGCNNIYSLDNHSLMKETEHV